MSSSDEIRPYRTFFKSVPLVVLVVGFVFLLGLAVAAGDLVFQKWFTNRQTDITRQTNQYQTSSQQHLSDLKQAYLALNTDIAKYSGDPANAQIVEGFKGQQQGIVDEMRRQIAIMQPNQVPPDIQDFLRTVPYR